MSISPSPAQMSELKSNYCELYLGDMPTVLHRLCSRIDMVECDEICQRIKYGTALFAEQWLRSQTQRSDCYSGLSHAMSETQRKGFYLHEIHRFCTYKGQSADAISIDVSSESELRESTRELRDNFILLTTNKLLEISSFIGGVNSEPLDPQAVACAVYASSVNGDLPYELASFPELLGAGATAQQQLCAIQDISRLSRAIATVISALLLVATSLEFQAISGAIVLDRFIGTLDGRLLLKTIEDITFLSFLMSAKPGHEYARQTEKTNLPTYIEEEQQNEQLQTHIERNRVSAVTN
jgi:hypothetical protein